MKGHEVVNWIPEVQEVLSYPSQSIGNDPVLLECGETLLLNPNDRDSTRFYLFDVLPFG